MSQLKVDTITDEEGTGSPDFPNGISGDGSGLTNLPAENLTGVLPALDGSALTGVAPTTAQVTEAYAGANVNDVGTYRLAFYAISGGLGNDRGSAIAVGTTIAGSSLRVWQGSAYSNRLSPDQFPTGGTFNGSTSTFPTAETVTLPGTWRVMVSGRYRDFFGQYSWWPLLWLRIS